ncbi:DMT family transporter [Streptomyces sp. NPDC049744]|uniref:DMT family transporter n=1 Tax=Streptomyces sp. NPDC049744 TaxID=3154359 RepID=UPI0034443CDC
MSALALSVLLSLVSAVAYAGGAIVQEQVAASSPDAQYAPLRRPAWWAAVSLNGLGGLLHVVALALGPLSLVQPLGALTIVFALPMAALFVGRRAGATAWRGALMATVGLAGLLSLVGVSDAQSLDSAQRVGAAVVTGGAVVALMIAGRAAHRHPAVRSILLATASGIAFGMSSVFTKTVAVDWSGGVSAGDLPSLAVIGVLATAGMVLSQASYRGAGLAAPLATLTVVNPVVAAIVGITMFGETFRYGTAGTVLALGCGVVAAGGLIMLTTERIAREGTETGEAASVPAEDTVELPEPAAAALGSAALGSAALGAVPVGAAAPVGVAVPVDAPVEDVREPVAAAVPVARAAQRAAVTPVTSLDRVAPLAPVAVVAPAARLSEKVVVPSPVAAPVPDTAPAEEAYEVRAPVESDDTTLSYGPFYGGPFVPPPMLGRRRRVRIRS